MDYYEIFAFGDSPEMADELLALVLAGKKTATASSIPKDKPMPKVGDRSLVLDGAGNPACVIETTAVAVVPLCEMSWEMAKREGEDETLDSWIQGNIRYFTREAKREGYTFSEDMPLVFEDFVVVERDK
ncbi:RNA-binding protein [Clostridia bacterium]|nr:RNA-binding protein [Clostridia bacterium]